MEEIGILVANHPRLMRGAVCAALSCKRDIEVVGDIQGEPEMFAAICDSVLDEHPHMKICGSAWEHERGDSYYSYYGHGECGETHHALHKR